MNDIDVIGVRYASLLQSLDREKSILTASNANIAPSKEKMLCSSTFEVSLGQIVKGPELTAVSTGSARRN